MAHDFQSIKLGSLPLTGDHGHGPSFGSLALPCWRELLGSNTGGLIRGEQGTGIGGMVGKYHWGQNYRDWQPIWFPAGVPLGRAVILHTA